MPCSSHLFSRIVVRRNQLSTDVFTATIQTMLIISAVSISLYLSHIMLCEAYKVLIVFPTPGKSHSILADGIIRPLLEAGHEVTYITTFPKDSNTHPSLREIDISVIRNILPEEMFSIDKIMKKEIDIRGMASLLPMFHSIQTECLENENVTKLLSDPKEEFDLVILEWMFADLISGISAVFNCPYIWVSTVDPHWMVLRLIDELPNPAYITGLTSNNAVPLSFLQRAEELFQMTLGLGLQYFYLTGVEHRDYVKLLMPHIRKRGHSVPDFEVVRHNASLMLGNSHVSMGQPTRLPQSYKPIGGFHIDVKTSPLSAELQKILDSAKHGLIYFSMGTLSKSKYMPSEVKVSLLKMFGKLKQTVLWKFEEDLPNRPKNVHIVQWAPQQSILAHPNCILFITHGGLLSTTEAIHFGKPVIGIPIFGDQFTNVDRYVKRGIAKKVGLSFTMADELEEAIKDIIADPRYLINVKALSFIYHDRPVPPAKEMIHWIEHVIRTDGASHLRSPALFVSWYQKAYLDLMALILISLWAMKLVTTKLVSHFPKTQQKRKIL